METLINFKISINNTIKELQDLRASKKEITLALRGIRTNLLSDCNNYYEWEIFSQNWKTETRKRIKAKYDFITQKIEEIEGEKENE